jgi:hypothetical protein
VTFHACERPCQKESYAAALCHAVSRTTEAVGHAWPRGNIQHVTPRPCQWQCHACNLQVHLRWTRPACTILDSSQSLASYSLQATATGMYPSKVAAYRQSNLTALSMLSTPCSCSAASSPHTWLALVCTLIYQHAGLDCICTHAQPLLWWSLVSPIEATSGKAAWLFYCSLFVSTICAQVPGVHQPPDCEIHSS